MSQPIDHSLQPPVTDAEAERSEAFWTWLTERGRRGHTLKAYHTDWQMFARWYHTINSEPFDLSRLTALDVNDYRIWALAQQLAPSTINRRIGFLKHYAGWGVNREQVSPRVYQAIKEVPLARKQQLAPRGLSQAEVRHLLNEVELRAPLRDQAIIYTLLYTGLRVGELAHLRVAEVDVSERKGTILIQGEHAKGGKQRQVPVPLKARNRLIPFLEKHPKKTGILFLGQRGPLSEDAIARVVKKYAAWAKLEGVTPHTLRHTFAYTYLEKTGNDLVGLANILGHDNLTTTQIYTQKPLTILQAEVEKVQYF